MRRESLPNLGDQWIQLNKPLPDYLTFRRDRQPVERDWPRGQLTILTTEGEIDLKLRGSRVPSVIAGHWAAVKYFLATGDERGLFRFRGRKVAGRRVAIPWSTRPANTFAGGAPLEPARRLESARRTRLVESNS
jgi:hypothetical protein